LHLYIYSQKSDGSSTLDERGNKRRRERGKKGGTSAGGKGDERGEILEAGENTWQRACAAEGTKRREVKYCRSRLWHPQDVT